MSKPPDLLQGTLDLLILKTTALLVSYVVLAVAFQRATPVLEATDEARHFGMALLISETGTLPRASATERTIAAQEVTQAPLYYALSAMVIRGFDLSAAPAYFQMTPGFIAGRADLPGPRNMFLPRSELRVTSRHFEAAIGLLRWASTLMGLGVVVLTLLSFRVLLPGDPDAALFAAAVVAFNPMFLFMHTSVNNDCLLNLLAATVVYALLKTSGSRSNLPQAIAGGLLLGLAIMTKLSGVVLAPALLLHLFWRASSRRSAALHLSAFVGAATAVSGWWFARNVALYGSATASALHARLAGNGRASIEPLALLFEWDGFVKSYWGVFGGFNIIYADAVYGAFYGLSLVLLALAAFGVLTLIRRRRQIEGVLLALLIVTNLLAVAYWTSFLLGSQGRLLFPSIVASAQLAACGLTALPPVPRTAVSLITVAFLIGCSAWAAYALIPGSYLS